MRRILILWHILLYPLLGYSQICGRVEEIIIPNFSTNNIEINIAQGDLVNEDLATNQGLCGIELDFAHAFVDELAFSLVSPAGQSVQLTGPAFSDPANPLTGGARWRISFVPNSTLAEPDFGFNSRWDNGQANNFINGGQYFGSYYPFNGSLEDFNTGNIFGTWTLVANNNISSNTGGLRSIRLIFCNETGLDCCFADAGNLRDPDLLVCQDDPSLNFTPDLRYSQPRPSAADYGYTYVVSRDSILLSYSATEIDLVGAAPGTYQVCGLSYLLADVASLPQPNDAYTIGELFTDLESLTPTFCAELTGDCQEIVIEEPPPTLTTIATICEGENYPYFDSTYTVTGAFPYVHTTAAGCDSTVIISLTVTPPKTTAIDTIICAGETVPIGTSTYNTTGLYRDTLASAVGCDSIVVLDLEILAPINTTLDTAICQGDSLLIGTQTFFNAINTSVTLVSAQNCDSTVNLNLQVLEPIINFAPVDIITCSDPNVLIDASASTPTGIVTYEWQDIAGNVLGTAASLSVDQAGDYVLFLTQSALGIDCSVVDTINVPVNESFPLADAGPPQILSCDLPIITLGGNGTSVGADYTYLWTTDTGNFLDSPTIANPRVDAAGRYTLLVTNISSSCTATSIVDIGIDQEIPVVQVLPDTIITCTNPTLLLTSTGSSLGPNFAYQWRDDQGNVLGTEESLSVDRGSNYQLLIQNIVNGCRDSATVSVAVDTPLPIFSIDPPAVINCDQNSIRLNATTSIADPDLSFNWQATNGGNIAADANTLTPLIDSAGIYQLTFSNSRTGCETTAEVEVIDQRNQQSAQIAVPDVISCEANGVILDGSNSSAGPNVIYQWVVIEGDGQFIGDSTGNSVVVNDAGTYSLYVLDTLSLCHALTLVDVLRDLDSPVAEAGIGFTINCQVQQDTLFGTGSTLGPDISYSWTGPCLLSDPNSIWVIADCAGTYYLDVTDTNSNCTIRDSVVIGLDQQTPVANVLPVDTITCERTTITLDATPSTPVGNLNYSWSGPGISGTANGSQVSVSIADDYQLIVSDATNFCQDTLVVNVPIDENIPVAIIGPPDTLNCVTNEVILDGSASSTGPNIIYRWTRVSNGALIAQTATAVTNEPGTFTLEVVDTISQCRATATIRIVEFNLPINLSFGDSILACGQDTFALTAFPEPLSNFYTYQWSGPEIADQADSATVLIAGIGAYTLAITDQRSECQTTVTVTVTEDEACSPCVLIAAPDTLTCNRTTVDLQADFCLPCTGCVLQWTTTDGNIVANGNTLQPTVDQAGIYQLNILNLEGFQTDVTVEVFAQNTPPIADAGPDRFLTCDSTTVNLGVLNNALQTNLSYRWTSVSNPTFLSSNTPTVDISAPGTYWLEVRDTLTGCSSLDSVAVSYDTIVPIAVAGVDRILTCTESFVILDGIGSSSGNGLTYTWTSDNPGSCLQGANTISPIVSCAGTYYLTVKNTISGCMAVDSLTVASSADIPLLNPLPDTAFICGQDSILLEGTIPAPTGYSFAWCTLDANGQQIPTSCVTDLNLMVGTSGLYQFTVQDDITSCEASFIVEVDDLRASPLVNVGNDLIFSCTDDSLTLNTTIGPDPSVLDFQWQSLNNLPLNNSNTLSPTVYGPDTLILLVSNRQTNCTAQDTIVLTQDINAPTVNAGLDTVLNCLQATVTLQGSGLSANGGSIGYQWSTSDGSIQANDDTAMPLINRAGTYVLTITDEQNGCTATDALVVVDAQQAPLAAVAGLDDLQFSCDIDSLLLDASPSSAVNGGPLDYFWSVVSSGNLIGDPTQVSLQTDAIGTYRLVVTDQTSGCRDSFQFTLNAAFGAPVVRIADPEQFTCERNAVTLDATTSEFGPGYTASWFNAQGEILLNDNLQLTVTEVGTYTLQIDNNNTGCSNISAPVEVTVDTLLPVVNLAPPDLLDCAITSVQLDGLASSQGAEFQYEWTTTEGMLLDAGNQALSTAGAPGIYQLEITNLSNACSASDTIRVEAITAPITSTQFQLIPPNCINVAGGSIVVDSVRGGTAPFTYRLNDGVELTAGIFNQLRAGSYTLGIRDANGCEWEEEIIIPDIPDINVDLGPDIAISIGDSVRLEAQTSAGEIAVYQWEPATDVGANGSPSQVVAPEVSSSYGVTVTDVNGCVASDRIMVLVEKSRAFYIPTAFTPDGDGTNDLFTVLTGPEVVNIPSFRIYDRWGHLVYDRQDIPPNDPNLGWDGYHNGRLMNAAVFVYYIELEYNDGWIEPVKGDVTLLR